MMKAIVLRDFGPADNLKVEEVEQPSPGPNQVLVRVRATSVNPADAGVRSGMFGKMVSLPARLGFDVAGEIAELGAGVEGWQVGDAVYYAVPVIGGMGANAEYTVANVSQLVRKPDTLSFAEAAAVPVAGGTAYAALISGAKLQLGESVLIHGGAGGVGSFAVQIAKAAGAFVVATCGGYDEEHVAHLGADVVLDYREDDIGAAVRNATDGAGVDVVLDASGGGQLVPSIEFAAANGRLVTVTGARGDLSAAGRKNLSAHFVHLDDTAPKLEVLRRLIDRKQVRPLIGAHFSSLDEIAEAHRRVEAGGEALYGKAVVDIV